MALQLLALRRQQLPLRSRHPQLLPQLLSPLILAVAVAAGMVDLHGAGRSLEGDVIVGGDLLEEILGLYFEDALLWILGGKGVEDGRGGDQLVGGREELLERARATGESVNGVAANEPPRGLGLSW